MKVSVIVPVYNTGKYLKKCLDSLVNQDFSDYEIIIINDGSTDNSEEIIKEYQKKNKHFKYQKITNHGQGYARNLGMKLAKGEYIMFLDSDDYLDSRTISLMVNQIKDCDVAVSNIYKVIDSKNTCFNNYQDFGNDQINLMLSHPGPVAKLYKREVLENVRFLENVYYEDLAFTPIVALNVHKVSFINEYLYYYVIHDNSTMKQKEFNNKINSIFTVMEYLSERLSNYPDELEYLYIEHLMYSATLRYLDYPNQKSQLLKINEIMQKYPRWSNNKYFKKKSYKFKLVCYLAKYKQYCLLKLMKKVCGK